MRLTRNARAKSSNTRSLTERSNAVSTAFSSMVHARTPPSHGACRGMDASRRSRVSKLSAARRSRRRRRYRPSERSERSESPEPLESLEWSESSYLAATGLGGLGGLGNDDLPPCSSRVASSSSMKSARVVPRGFLGVGTTLPMGTRTSPTTGTCTILSVEPVPSKTFPVTPDDATILNICCRRPVLDNSPSPTGPSASATSDSTGFVRSSCHLNLT